MKKVRTVIVGCGNVAKSYAAQMGGYEEVELLGFVDIDAARAEAFAKEYGGKPYADLEEALQSEDVELVVNLTIHHAHVEVITRCLEAGKHVHTEKPLAMSYADAKQLVDLAEEKGLRLSSAPSTFLGEPVETLAEQLKAGRAGKVRVSYAEINHGRIETWHPNPVPFYQVGPVWDVAVYPLGVWAALCGPVKRVQATGKVLKPERVTKDGQTFTPESPDFVVAMLEFENGMLGRLTTNFYVKPSKQGASMEFHGDEGSFALSSSYLFDAKVEYAPFGGEWETVELVRPGKPGIEFARGVQDLAAAMREGRPHRCAARRAAHVVEIIEAIHRSAKEERPVELASSF